MKLSELYKRNVEEALNPAVSVSDYNPETVKIEIEEYVFTDDIVNGLYDILRNIRSRSTSHNGIWINGYYGSGKSHFLKYLNFCISKEFGPRAQERLLEAVEEFDPLTHPSSNSRVEISEMRDIIQWLKTATVDNILFNIGDKIGDKVSEKTTFTKALWEEFNKHRGFSGFNVALAQYLEKPLAEKGKFEEFKARMMEEEGHDWMVKGNELVNTEIDMVLDLAKEVVPSLSTDIIRERIANNDINLSVESFTSELKAYIDGKDDNYRLLFFIDEVSQFIGDRQELLLQLQQICTRLQEDCKGKVWVGCTAQVDLSEIIDGCAISQASDDYGKIMGRFETRATLKGNQTEYITQKRILAKKAMAEVKLGEMYTAKSTALSTQFQLPSQYHAYNNQKEFIDYYPFVPYQFPLIMRVFDSFVNLAFVDKEVKGNERSVLKITHSAARQTADYEVGKFISFDEFFRSMFQGGLKPAGTRAIRNAEDAVKQYDDKDFASKVVNVMFMICNMSEQDRVQFPANLDNIVTLLMTDVDENKFVLRGKVEKVLGYLRDNNVIKLNIGKDDAPDYYSFYSEDEVKAANQIKSIKPDNTVMAEEFRKIATDYLHPSNKFSFNGTSFSLCLSILQRNYLTTSNPDITVELTLETPFKNKEQYAWKNSEKKLSFYIFQDYDKELHEDFYWYCQVRQFLTTQPDSQERQRTMSQFREMAADRLRERIVPAFKTLLDTCPVIAGHQILPDGDLTGLKGADRYNAAVNALLEQIYVYHKMVSGSEFPKNAEQLRQKITRPIQPDEYTILPLLPAEQEVENHLAQNGHELVVTDIIRFFQQDPYGWNEYATTYVLNELVRRHMRAFTYGGNHITDSKVVADRILKESGKFVVTEGKEIPQQLINEFVSSWKTIFGIVNDNLPVDGNEIFNFCRNDAASKLNQAITKFPTDAGELTAAKADSLAAILNAAVAMFEDWKSEREPQNFFHKIIDAKEEGAKMFDRCKEVFAFKEGQQFKRFKDIISFYEMNKDAFSLLPEESREKAAALAKILSDDDLLDNLPKYVNLSKELRFDLETFIDSLKDRIRIAADDCFAKLEEFCRQKSIPLDKMPSKERELDRRCTLSNPYVLIKNENFNDYLQQQIAYLSQFAPKSKKTVTLSLKTQSKTLTNEQEVNNYLQQLKAQLMQHINNDEDVIVL